MKIFGRRKNLSLINTRTRSQKDKRVAERKAVTRVSDLRKKDFDRDALLGVVTIKFQAEDHFTICRVIPKIGNQGREGLEILEYVVLIE